MSLSGLIPKPVKEILLLNGKKVEILIRPFILADKAWWEQSFTPEELKGLEALEVTPMCKAIWHQLDVESKKLFGKIEFKDADDDGEEITVNIVGFKKLTHSIKTLEDIVRLYGGVIKSIKENDFIPDGVKKKIAA